MEDIVEPRDLEPWLRQALRTQITTAEKAIQKVKGDVETQIASLKEVTADLSAKSDRDSAEKRNDKAVYKSARAVGRMCQELQGLSSAFSALKTQSSEGLKQFSDGTAKFAGDATRIRDRWIGQIRPYYILDMMSLNASIEKLRRLGDQAWDVFSKEGDILRGIEEIREKAQKVQELDQSLRKQLEEHDQLLTELGKVEPQISEARNRIESLARDPRLAGLRKIDNRLSELRAELIASGFRRLGRPLRKLESMSTRGEYPMAPEVREKLGEYLKRPFTTFIHEGEGFPYLRSVLRSMRGALERRKLVLKQREERKVLERIQNVTERNVLNSIHKEATALLAEREGHLHDPACVELVKEYRLERQLLKDLKSQRAELERRSKMLMEKTEVSKQALSQFVKETELLGQKLARKPVKIRMSLA